MANPVDPNFRAKLKPIGATRADLGAARITPRKIAPASNAVSTQRQAQNQQTLAAYRKNKTYPGMKK
jgi:hypothetical protein